MYGANFYQEKMKPTICTGEKIFKSPLTGVKYRVTKWEDFGNGNIRAIHKEEILE